MKRVLISILARVKGNVNANGTIAALTEIKKFFTTEGETKVYVSGRCVKYCIKERLREKGFPISPLERSEERGQRVLLPEGNPIENIDEDLFGYLIPAQERKRFAPIKTNGIVALRHCEITRDFGGRFDPTEKEHPSPFEVEVADFIGQNNWILTESIGKFEYKTIKRDNRKIETEITKEIIDNSPIKLEEKYENRGKVYYLPLEPSAEDKKYGRKNRLNALLEILLKERYTFPRSATGLHQPHYYYAVILLTDRLLPLFANVDYEIKDGKVLLDLNKIEDLACLLNEGEDIVVIDFEQALLDDGLKLKKKEYEETIKNLEEKSEKSSNNEQLKEKIEQIKGKAARLESIEIIELRKIDEVINKISKFLFGA